MKSSRNLATHQGMLELTTDINKSKKDIIQCMGMLFTFDILLKGLLVYLFLF